jgi:hypothetical protein
MDLPTYILERLATEGSPTESDLSRLGSDPYKPFYRALVIVLGWYEDDPDGHPIAAAFEGRKPTPAEVKVLLSETHPWFKRAIARDPDQFESTYEFIKEAWA